MLTGSLSRQGGGVFDSVRGLSLALRDHEKLDVHVFGLADENTEDDRAAWQGLPLHAATVTGPRRFGYAKSLARAVRSANLDVLHIACTWMYPSLVSLEWTRRTGKPVVVSPRGDLDPWAITNSRWKKTIAAAAFERRHLAHAACLHALNDEEVTAFRAFGLSNPICIIPNGVDLPPPASAPVWPAAWTEVVPRGAKVIYFLGRLHPKKNVASLIEAWARIADRQPAARSWWLVIAGWDQGGHESSLKKLVTDAAVPRVHFSGAAFGVEKSAALSSASVFALPSLSEGLPRAVLEAWSYARPVLLSPACNLPEGVRAGAAVECGVTADEIASGLLNLIEMDDAARIEMGRRGRRLVEERFTWPSVAAETHKLYRWLLDGVEPPEGLAIVR